MARLLCLLTVCVFSQGILATIDFDCRTLVPRGRIESDKQAESPFKITTSGTQYSPGGHVNVTLATSGRPRISHFVLQARHPLDDVPLGSWEVYSSDQKTHRCSDEADTVVSGANVFREVEQLKARWIPPQEAGNGQVEFVATVKNSDGLFWMDINSILIKEMTSFTLPRQNGEVHRPVQPVASDPDQDHGLRLESDLQAQMEEKRQKMLDDEDANSEGDWTKQVEKERQDDEEEHRKEEMEYEVQAQKEDQERMARIRMEILDKEAFDREQAERQKEEEERLREERENEREERERVREENERKREREEEEIEIGEEKRQDNTAGSSAVAPMLATLFAMLFACLL